jgi:type IX secretion system PorP/SprF family membrane protein
MMKRFLTLLLLIGGWGLHAQQLPQYTQYTFNELLINPAVTGVESYWDTKAGYRNQWAGLQGSPTTSYLTLSVPLNKSFTKNDFEQMIRNSESPLTRQSSYHYKASPSHNGVGLTLLSDKTGQINQTHVDATYAYHLRMANQFNLSAGASFGFNNISLNTSQVTLANQLDPVINQGATSQLKPEVGLGVWAYGANFFAGAAVAQLLPVSISFSNGAGVSKTYAQYFLTAGFRTYLSDDVTMLPSIMFRPAAQGPSTYDLNMKFAFRDNFWFGGAYRKSDAVAASFGFNLGSFLNLGYSYDYTTSELNQASYGTHEIMIGVLLRNNYNVTSPRHTW